MSLSFRTNGNFIDFVNTDATTLQVETVIMSLHNTSRCIDWSLPEDTSKISFTIDEVKYSNIPISEIDFDGTVMNSQDDFQTGVEAMFPGLAGGVSGGSSYLMKTYAQLIALIGSSGLVAGTQYEISDFATKHYIVDGDGLQYLGDIITGTTEPLIVTAVSTNKIDSVAKSTLYPNDIIYYDYNPDNWVKDKSFSDVSGTPTIISGFKGVIYFRHDTILNNSMGYDFRNCKFRRWKTDTTNWSDATTYAKGDIVNNSGKIYISREGSNLNNTPSTSSDFWSYLIDISTYEYVNNSPTSTNDITSGASFDDFYTFSGDNYELVCTGNVFEWFKDDFDNGNSRMSSILQNNVFFIGTDIYFSILCNSFGLGCYLNTFVCGGQTMKNNTIGASFMNNQVGEIYEENSIGNFCKNNIFGTNAYNNVIGNSFQDNRLSNVFETNVIGNDFQGNITGNDVFENNFHNSIRNNTLGRNFGINTIGAWFIGNQTATGFTMNEVQDDFNKRQTAPVNFLSATHVYASYNCSLFVNSDLVQRLSYFDNADVLTVANANA